MPTAVFSARKRKYIVKARTIYAKEKNGRKGAIKWQEKEWKAMKESRRTLAAAFFMSLAVFLINISEGFIKAPEIIYKILGVVIIILGIISAGVSLVFAGVYDRY